MRYFAELSYMGTQYNGWQKQPNCPSVQATIEEALTTILRKSTEVVGCGRTDTGVHARQYFLHFDFEQDFPKSFLKRLNKYLPPDISFKNIHAVENTAHARFDATHRAYEYHIDFRKNPFATHLTYHFPHCYRLDLDLLNEAAQLLLQFDAFYPFCKSKTDVKTMDCQLYKSEWQLFTGREEQLVFYIAANRFLRGMVRLIVGMCLNVGLKKLHLDEVKKALEKQERLRKSLSVPPQGLYLMDIHYPFVNQKMEGI
ncbi:MAG: tRNA pseudouridine(38-40) synthase TruA [Bacteroidota bacterium]